MGAPRRPNTRRPGLSFRARGCASGEGAHEEAVCGLPGRGQEAWLPQMLQGVPFRVTWRARLCAVQGNRRVARADRRPAVPSHEDNPTCTLHKAFAIGLLTGALLGRFGRTAAAPGLPVFLWKAPTPPFDPRRMHV